MRSSAISLIIPLVDAAESRKAGCRAGNLSKLGAARFAVPRGFVITSDAYSVHLWASGARGASVTVDSPEAVESIRASIISTEIAPDIWQGVADAYHRLSLQVGFADPKVTVAASPVEDDRSGVQEGAVRAAGLDALNDAIKQVWADAWAAEAAARLAGEEPGESSLAVVVQQDIEGGARGRACTADLETSDPRIVVVSCLNGEGTCSLRVDLRDVRIAEREGELPEGLSEAAVVRLAEQAVLAERVAGLPLELEWTYEGGEFWILQACAVAARRKRASEDCDEEARRVSSKPVSHLARRLFWSGSPSADASVPALSKMWLENGYVYCCKSSSEASASGWQNAAERALRKWRRDVGPETTSKASAILRSNLAERDYNKLIKILTEAASLAVRARGWMDRMSYPAAQCVDLLTELAEDPKVARELLGGIAGPTFMRDARLQELADRFAAADKTGKLADEAWRRAYRQEVKQFAADYGYSFLNLAEMADPESWRSWIEDLDTVFHMIGAIARRGNRPSLVTLHFAAEQCAADAEKKLAAKQPKLAKLIKTARGWLAARDESEHAFALACTALRLTADELGRRLCESGLIARREDIFSIAIDELASIPETPADADKAELAAKIAARKHEAWLEERLAVPDGVSSSAKAHKPSDAARPEIRCQCICPGEAAGRVRVARSIADAGQMEEGEVLVVESLGLAWTPFLGLAGAIVSESGSHESPGWSAAAADYGIPVVAGCGDAAGALSDGLRFEVDASAGLIR